MSQIVKKIDDLGRISIPKEMRRALHWMVNDKIELNFSPEQGTIVLKKSNPSFSEQMFEIKDALTEWAQENDVKLSNEFQDNFLNLIESIQKICNS